jgi:arsenate reductase-like glutaredoxin family protein
MNKDNKYEILEKLNILVKLTAVSALKDFDFNQKVMTLHDTGMKPKDIAEILGKTPNHVRVTISTFKKEKQKLNKGNVKKLEVNKNE